MDFESLQPDFDEMVDFYQNREVGKKHGDSLYYNGQRESVFMRQ